MTGRHQNFTDDFRRDAVRLNRESDRAVVDVADDLGIGKSKLISWQRRFADEALLSGPHDDLETKNARLCKENEILRHERDLLKRRPPSSLRKNNDDLCLHLYEEGGYSCL